MRKPIQTALLAGLLLTQLSVVVSLTAHSALSGSHPQADAAGANGAIYHSEQPDGFSSEAPMFRMHLSTSRRIDIQSAEMTGDAGVRVVIDNQVRYLGSHLPGYASAGGQTRVLPSMKFPFSVAGKKPAGPTVLTIGAVQGVNTREAHRLGQNTASHVSSPMVVKLNGRKVCYISRNGHNMRVPIPAHLLNPSGVNILQLESGFYFPQDNQIAYDQIELKGLALEL